MSKKITNSPKKSPEKIQTSLPTINSPKPPENNIAISVQNLNITFGSKKVVKDVSFQVKKGEINGFLGISGAGKTTIIRVLTCQIPAKHWTGEVTVGGISPKKRANYGKILSKIGYVPQLEEANLYYDLTPYENLDIFASTYGLDKAAARQKADEIFKILAIPSDTVNNPVSNMSGGEKKRLSMALGMINAPEILFLDEPTTGVDASKRYEILNYLKRMNEKLKTTLMLITHDLEAAHICDTVAILKNGELIEYGAPKKLIESLPSKGQIVRLTFEILTEDMIDLIKKISFIKIVVRNGINTIEVFMDNFEQNLINLMDQLQKLHFKVIEMSRDIVSFQTYFQLRIATDDKNKSVKKGI